MLTINLIIYYNFYLIYSYIKYILLFLLAAWFLDLKDRIRFISDWRDHGIPSAFWISGFYFPQAFLTGTLQNFARKHIVSIDTIDFSYKVRLQSVINRLIVQRDVTHNI